MLINPIRKLAYREREITTPKPPTADPTTSLTKSTIDVPEAIFPKFKELPTELRLRIWEEAFDSVGRVVTIGWGDLEDLVDSRDIGCHRPYRQPKPLSICQETRAEALKHYKLILQRAIPDSLIYFHPAIDTLCASTFIERFSGLLQTTSTSIGIDYQFLAFIMYKDITRLMNIQSMTMSDAFWAPLDGTPDSNKKAFRNGMRMSFHNLRKLTLVTKKPGNYRGLGRTILDTEDGKEACRQEIIAMYEDEREKFPDCKIPEICIVDWFDPVAPVFRFGGIVEELIGSE